MVERTTIAGLDVHKDSIDVSITEEDAPGRRPHGKIARDLRSVDALIRS